MATKVYSTHHGHRSRIDYVGSDGYAVVCKSCEATTYHATTADAERYQSDHAKPSTLTVERGATDARIYRSLMPDGTICRVYWSGHGERLYLLFGEALVLIEPDEYIVGASESVQVVVERFMAACAVSIAEHEAQRAYESAS